MMWVAAIIFLVVDLLLLLALREMRRTRKINEDLLELRRRIDG
jgi:hypothetical protein